MIVNLRESGVKVLRQTAGLLGILLATTGLAQDHDALLYHRAFEVTLRSADFNELLSAPK